MERRSTRGSNDGRSALEKAHDIKRKWVEGDDKECRMDRPAAPSLENNWDGSELANSVSPRIQENPAVLRLQPQRPGKKTSKINNGLSVKMTWGAGHDILVHAAEGDGPCAGRLVFGRLICTWVVKLCLRLLATLFLFLFLFVAWGYPLLGDGSVPSSQY